MGEIRGIIPEDVEIEFRKLAMTKFGYGKGSISKALEQAMRHWILVEVNNNSQKAPSDM